MPRTSIIRYAKNVLEDDGWRSLDAGDEHSLMDFNFNTASMDGMNRGVSWHELQHPDSESRDARVFGPVEDGRAFARYINTKLTQFIVDDEYAPNTDAQRRKHHLAETFVRRLCTPFLEWTDDELRAVAIPSKKVLNAYRNRISRSKGERPRSRMAYNRALIDILSIRTGRRRRPE
jgi:hypothetical protein